MDLLTIFTILIFISAAISYLNDRFVKLPGTIGIVSISVVASIIILIVGKTSNSLTKSITDVTANINFPHTILDLMLGFLMFASAIHFDYQKLKEQRWSVLLLTTLGVLVSAFVFGALFYFVMKLFPVPVPFFQCLLFGALISPTDPISVAAIIRKSKVPERLKTIISGESLFNDGVGLVLFVVILEISGEKGTGFSFLGVLKLFTQEVIGGIAIGLILGFVGYRLMRTINDFQTLLLISLSMVFGISLLAKYISISIPLTSVAAGLVIGNRNLSKKGNTKNFLMRIWQLIDEILNTVLFVMIGLELVVLPYLKNYWLTGFLAVIIILVARLVSISLPALLLLHRLNYKNLAILTWSGLRGGISLAMALSLPASPYKTIILSACYFIVIFSTIVQGLTLNKLVNYLVGQEKEKNQPG
ncbi:MAG TPA: sodium:proton antiporter [Hanamia sp.]|nr:sodium:proton antiporter [Hanamia sp.]